MCIHLLYVGVLGIFDEISNASFVDCDYHEVSKVVSKMLNLDIVVLRNEVGMNREWIDQCCELLATVARQHERKPWIVIDDESLDDLHWLFDAEGISTYIGQLEAVADMRFNERLHYAA